MDGGPSAAQGELWLAGRVRSGRIGDDPVGDGRSGAVRSGTVGQCAGASVTTTSSMLRSISSVRDAVARAQ